MTCAGCAHSPHLGRCNSRLGGTAYRCGCLLDTIPTPSQAVVPPSAPAVKDGPPLRVNSLHRNTETTRSGTRTTVTIVAETLWEPHMGLMRVRIENMVELEKGLRAVLNYVREAVDSGWRPKSEDVGPGCYKARQLLAKIDEAAEDRETAT